MAATLDSPIDSVDLADVGGHVDALGLLTLTDASGQPRDDLTVAIQEDYDPENPEPLRLAAGTLDALAGSLVGDDIEATTLTQWQAIAATGNQPHRGRWAVCARITVGTNPAGPFDSEVRFLYRSGDGPFRATSRPVVRPHISGSLIEVDLGIANIEEAEGTHTWFGQVEIRGDTTEVDFKLRELQFVPADRMARLRAPRSAETITGAVAHDGFAHTAGTLDGQTAPLGGTWDRVAGDTDDFTVGLGSAQRATINDSAIGSGPIGILERLGTGTATLTVAQVDVNLPTSLPNGAVAGGLLVRYVDADNYLVAVRGHDALGNSIAYLMKVIAGAATVIAYKHVSTLQLSSWRTVGVAVDADGNVALFEGPQASSLSKLDWVAGVAADTDLATGGVLDDGGYGLHDASSVTSGAPLRLYDNFLVSDAAAVDHVVNPNQSLRIDHRSAEREDATGTSWGDVPSYTGRRLFVPPATRNGNVSRLVVKQDRNDLTQLPVGEPSAAENLCTNPSAATDTVGWTNSGLVTFERSTSPPAGGPAATAFHAVGNAGNDHAYDEIAVESGKTYRFSAYVYLDSSTASGIALFVRDPVPGHTEAVGATFSTLDAWTRIALSVTATETDTWRFRLDQIGGGSTDFYFAGVEIAELDWLTATLSVTPRVLLTS